MSHYLLIVLAGMSLTCFFIFDQHNPLTASARMAVHVISSEVTIRKVIWLTGAIVIAILFWQLAGVEFAFFFSGEVMTYIEIASAVYLFAGRRRLMAIVSVGKHRT